MKQELLQEYEKYLKYDKKKFAEIREQIQLLAFLRLFAFLGIILSLVFKNALGSLIAFSLVVIFIVLFFYWIKRFIQKEKKKLLFANLIEINQKEILALGEKYDQFDSGKDFIDPSHSFSYDIDLFGEGSFFQFINRTITQLGRKKLASFLSEPITDIEILQQRQKALQELSKHTRWRQFFSAKGQTHDEDDFQLLRQITEIKEICNWKFVKWIVLTLPILSFCCLILWVFSMIPWSAFLMIIIINSSVLYAYRKTITSFYQRFGNQSKILESYLELLLMIETKEFESASLRELKQQLSLHEQKASQILGSLRKTMSRFDYRANFVFAIVAELVFIWDLICVYQLYNWNQKYKDFFRQCFDVIAEFDALSSLSNLNHNHPEWAVPSFEKQEFHFAANDLAHPLINSEKRVGNSFRMNGDGQIVIVTGANMAGKSTFLRALGVNLVLALNGCRVCASWLTLKPVNLYTNMRTTDNLQKDESYFFAELLRLQQMLDRIRRGEKLFLLIDEMLKGTNSQDKLSGSRALIKQLLRLNADGVVATHDLELTKMANNFPEQVRNMCFDVKLDADGLLFDYKLTEGITSTMNASYLMKKMGIIPAES